MLEVRALETAYGRSQVLFKVDFSIGEGEVVTLLGRNGMGKTTTVRSIMGITRPKGGRILFQGKAIDSLPSFRIAQAGLGLVPEGRQVFPNLTVHENLVATAANRTQLPHPWTLERVYGLFGNLRERQGNYGNQLSGGEQQMLAVGRALILNPRVMLLDEPLEGLAPILVEELLRALRRIIRDEGMSAILVEQNAQKVLGVTDRAAILERGAVVYEGASADLSADRAVLESYLGVTAVGPRRGGKTRH